MNEHIMNINYRNPREIKTSEVKMQLLNHSLKYLGLQRIFGTSRYRSQQVLQEAVSTDADVQVRAPTSVSPQFSSGEFLAKFYTLI